jgi:hypothetical protein
MSEGFSFSLDVLYGGLGISKMPFWSKKDIKKFSAVFFSLIFVHQNPGSGSGSGFPKVLDPYPYLNPDPQHCIDYHRHIKMYCASTVVNNYHGGMLAVAESFFAPESLPYLKWLFRITQKVRFLRNGVTTAVSPKSGKSVFAQMPR